MRRKNDKEKNYLILIMILSCTIIIMALINVFKTTQGNNKQQEPVYSGLSWNENQGLTNNADLQKYIAVPGITDLYFIPNSIEQTVNFYNPKENLCLMDIQLVTKDNGVIWKADSIKPDERIQTCPQLTFPTAKRVADFHRQVTAHFGQTKIGVTTFAVTPIILRF